MYLNAIYSIHLRIVDDSTVYLIFDLCQFMIYCLYCIQQSIEPWLQVKNHDLDHGEILQSKEDRKKLDGMYEVKLIKKFVTIIFPE